MENKIDQRPYWVPDSEVTECSSPSCKTIFDLLINRRVLSYFASFVLSSSCSLVSIIAVIVEKFFVIIAAKIGQNFQNISGNSYSIKLFITFTHLQICWTETSL